MEKKISILGIRGLPAAHGGFETFAQVLCPFLVENGWDVTVYCQELGDGSIYETEWENIKLVHIPINLEGSIGSIFFDLKSILHASKREGIHLTLGYNTSVFNIIQRAYQITNVINMDGIEWKRQKWGMVAKLWFWLNERFGCWFGNYLVADHPEIFNHLSTRVSQDKITTIAYGADEITEADEEQLKSLDLTKNKFLVVIARPEPENSILEIVEAFSSSKRNIKLVVLGMLEPTSNSYHKKIMSAASEEVIFPGAIYDKPVLAALRKFALFYVHGHQVGGTNPSLVEALGSGSAIIAHDNKFNRWVAKDAALYFDNKEDLIGIFDKYISDFTKVKALELNAIENFKSNFTWSKILKQYEMLLLKALDKNKLGDK